MPAANTVPNADRYQRYEPSSPTTSFPVPFGLWAGTLDEAKGDLEVRVDGVLTDAFTVTGTVNTDAQPNFIGNASVVLSSPVLGAVVEIEGLRQARRAEQFAGSVGVPPRHQNSILNAIAASAREATQRARRSFLAPQGERLRQLPSSGRRAGGVLTFDEGGQPDAEALSIGEVKAVPGLHQEALEARNTAVNAAEVASEALADIVPTSEQALADIGSARTEALESINDRAENLQPLDGRLTAISTEDEQAEAFVGFGEGGFGFFPMSAYTRGMLASASSEAMRTALGLDALLDAKASLTSPQFRLNPSFDAAITPRAATFKRVTSGTLANAVIALEFQRLAGSTYAGVDSSGNFAVKFNDVNLTAAPVFNVTPTGANVLGSAIQTASQKGVANGLASLDGAGRIPATQLPVDGSFVGTWNAATNTPTITSGSGVNGQFYIVNAAGTTTIDGVSSWAVGDQLRFSSTNGTWQKVTSSSGVASVNDKTGTVTLGKADIGLANADNTADAQKPVSAAQEARISVVTPWITPEMFSAVGDGVTDDTAAVQAAIDAIGSARAGEIKMPRSYRITAPVTISGKTVSMTGVAIQPNTRMTGLRLSGNGRLDLANAGGSRFHNMSFYAEADKTPESYQLTLVGSSNILFNGLSITAAGVGRYMSVTASSNRVRFHDVICSGGSGEHAFYFNNSNIFDFSFFSLGADLNTDLMVWEGSGGSARFTNFAMNFGKRAFVMKRQANIRSGFFYFAAGGWENFSVGTFDMQETKNIQIIGCYLSGGGGKIGEGTEDVRFEGNIVRASPGHGLESSGKQIVIVGNQFIRNGASANNTYSAIKLNASARNNFVLSNSFPTEVAYNLDTNTDMVNNPLQRHCVDSDMPASWGMIANNFMKGYATSAVGGSVASGPHIFGNMT